MAHAVLRVCGCLCLYVCLYACLSVSVWVSVCVSGCVANTQCGLVALSQTPGTLLMLLAVEARVEEAENRVAAAREEAAEKTHATQEAMRAQKRAEVEMEKALVRAEQSHRSLDLAQQKILDLEGGFGGGGHRVHLGCPVCNAM